MNTNLQNAQSLFDQFLFSRTDELIDLRNENQFEEVNLRRTQFKDMDTLLYSDLIKKALLLNPEIKTIIDFGAGSSIPTLLAIKNSGRTDVKTIAVDIDSEAKTVGEENARALNLSDNFLFFQGRMEEAIYELGPYGKETLIVSNPPYIASPNELNQRHFVPVNGGYFGDDYLLKILSYPYAAGVNLAILWGSLTSPQKVLPLIQDKFEKQYTRIYKTEFGDYTNAQPLKAHLYQLRDAGHVYFEDNSMGPEIQYVFGNILKSKHACI